MVYQILGDRLLCPWDFPGKNTGVGCHSFPSPGVLSHPGVKLGSPALQVGSLPSELVAGSSVGNQLDTGFLNVKFH